MDLKAWVIGTIEVVVLGSLFAALMYVAIGVRATNDLAFKRDQEFAEPITFADSPNQPVSIQNEFNSYDNPPVYWADKLEYGPVIVGAHLDPPREQKGPVCVERPPWRVWRWVFWRRYGLDCR